VFRLSKPTAADIAAALADVRDPVDSGARLLSLKHGVTRHALPFTFAHDRLRTRLGDGKEAFDLARRAFRSWLQFDLGWVRVANPGIPMAVGQIVAVEVRAVGLWSLNLSRIVETLDTDTQFGFLYATSLHHAEEGEERFLLELDPVEGGAWYLRKAVSRPRHPLARLMYPVTRALQHRFARQSRTRMLHAVKNGPPMTGEVAKTDTLNT
jgi:uncharacterized protein (UPF0548 family)